MSDTDEPLGHLSGEATPSDVPATAVPLEGGGAFGLHDEGWTEDQWFQLLQTLIKAGGVTWKEIAALVLGHLNPSQVGTSLASSEGFKRKYGKGNTMRVVMAWAYEQKGVCADCNTRLELQADHMKGREQYKDPLDADFIENMTLRCRRCNVVRRPSHELGGLTFLTAEAALMWILLVVRPRTFRDYVRMCRLYGMTMADIRMQEAWAMAHWLSRANPPAYGIEDDQKGKYDLILWPDSAITRTDPGSAIPEASVRLYESVSGDRCFGFLTEDENGRIKFYEQPLSFLPFSTYDFGPREPQALAIQYSSPDRENKVPQRLYGLAPRGMKLLTHAIRSSNQHFALVSVREHTDASAGLYLAAAPPYGRVLRTTISPNDCRLQVEANP